MTYDAKNLCGLFSPYIPKLYSEYRQNLKGSALFCVDLTWNDP